MKKLECAKKIKKYTKKINKVIEKEQSKKLYNSMLLHLPFVDDFRVNYKSHTDRLADAEELGDILLSGIQDIISIVAEDGFGIKDYEAIEDEHKIIEKFYKHLEKKYPVYVKLKLSSTTQKKIEKLKKFKPIKKKINEFRDVLEQRHTIHNHLRALEWKFIKLNTAIGLTKTGDIATYSDIQRLESEAREICDELVSKVKEHDKAMANISLLGSCKKNVKTKSLGRYNLTFTSYFS